MGFEMRTCLRLPLQLPSRPSTISRCIRRSTNTEANYEGRPDKLNEYAKRLIKLIDDCGTKQKARYIASLTRALLSKQIDTQKFFQLSRCIRNLTEEDLLFLSENIDQRNVSGENDYVADYRALGLLYETNNGFSYSKRAFELKKYALCYEKQIAIPESFPKKHTPLGGELQVSYNT